MITLNAYANQPKDQQKTTFMQIINSLRSQRMKQKALSIFKLSHQPFFMVNINLMINKNKMLSRYMMNNLDSSRLEQG